MICSSVMRANLRVGISPASNRRDKSSKYECFCRDSPHPRSASVFPFASAFATRAGVGLRTGNKSRNRPNSVVATAVEICCVKIDLHSTTK
jgi:hypothetical protein